MIVEPLVESLNLVAGVVVARTPKPALRCVLASAKDDALTFSATDTEVSIPHLDATR